MRPQAWPRSLECGGKRSATPLWVRQERRVELPKRRRRFALPAHSIPSRPGTRNLELGTQRIHGSSITHTSSSALKLAVNFTRATVYSPYSSVRVSTTTPIGMSFGKTPPSPLVQTL